MDVVLDQALLVLHHFLLHVAHLNTLARQIPRFLTNDSSICRQLGNTHLVLLLEFVT